MRSVFESVPVIFDAVKIMSNTSVSIGFPLNTPVLAFSVSHGGKLLEL